MKLLLQKMRLRPQYTLLTTWVGNGLERVFGISVQLVMFLQIRITRRKKPCPPKNLASWRRKELFPEMSLIEPLAQDAFPAEEAISKEDPMEMEKAAPEATLEVS